MGGFVYNAINRVIEIIYSFVILRFKETYKLTFVVMELMFIVIAFVTSPDSFLKGILSIHLSFVVFIWFSISGFWGQCILLTLSTLGVVSIANKISPYLYYDFTPSVLEKGVTSISNWRFWTSQLAYTWLYIFAGRKMFKYGYSLESVYYFLITAIIGVPLVRNLICFSHQREYKDKDLKAYNLYMYLILLSLNILYLSLLFLCALYNWKFGEE